MGRNKIQIEAISNERNRIATFMKRKAGLVKKAMELSILCGCEVSLLIFPNQNSVINYSSSPLEELYKRVSLCESKQILSNTEVNFFIRY